MDVHLHAYDSIQFDAASAVIEVEMPNCDSRETSMVTNHYQVV